ncbi:CBS domain-containing protein [Nitrososphaera sp.]|uniref:CBS domain-containing protein n=1 Tax=Nitrososphaera sp. TaxID=1971748 RepID=UPI0031749116
MQAQKRQMTAGNFMSSPVITVAADADLVDAVSVMALRNVGNVVVVEDERPVGILTERELLRYLAIRKEVPDILAGEVPLQGFSQLTPETKIEDAARIMVNKRSRLLVFRRDQYWQQKLAGIITASDLLRAFLETGKNPPIARVIRKKVFTLDYSRTVLAAVKTMYRRGVGSVVVEKDGQPYGIFTERDLLKNVLPRHVSLDEKVGRYCAHPLKTYRRRIGARTAGRFMVENAIKRLPLKYKGKIAGIVTARDLVEAFWRDL